MYAQVDVLVDTDRPVKSLHVRSLSPRLNPYLGDSVLPSMSSLADDFFSFKFFLWMILSENVNEKMSKEKRRKEVSDKVQVHTNNGEERKLMWESA